MVIERVLRGTKRAIRVFHVAPPVQEIPKGSDDSNRQWAGILSQSNIKSIHPGDTIQGPKGTAGDEKYKVTVADPITGIVNVAGLYYFEIGDQVRVDCPHVTTQK